MSWTDPSAHVYATGEVLSASSLNTYVKDNLIDLDRRTTQTSALVATSQTTASTSYTDLGTVGPAVTITIGAVGLLEVTEYTASSNNNAGSTDSMSYVLSGANTKAANDNVSIGMYSSTGGFGWRLSATFPETGLTAGSTTVTAKYKVNGGTGTFLDRRVVATPLGS